MKKGLVITLASLMILVQGILTFADTGKVINTDSMTSATLAEANEMYKVWYQGEAIQLDEPVKGIDGVMMVPVKPVLDKLGFEVKWNSETRSVDLIKDAQSTSLYIGENSYFKNKMAPHELSHAPVISENRTYVPVEFFSDILGTGMSVDHKNIYFSDDYMMIYEGFIQKTEVDEKGMMTLVISTKEKSEGLEDQVIVHAEEDYTFMNTSISVGDYIHVISPPIMTLTFPNEAKAYVIY